MLVGIAQEHYLYSGELLRHGGFNPCVSRNSSGAVFNEYADLAGYKVSIRVLVGIAQEPIGTGLWLTSLLGFQSVC